MQKLLAQASLGAQSVRVTVTADSVIFEISGCNAESIPGLSGDVRFEGGRLTAKFPGKFNVSEMLEISSKVSLARKSVDFYFYPPGSNFPRNFLKPRFAAFLGVDPGQLSEFGKEEISRSGALSVVHAVVGGVNGPLLDSPRGQIFLLNDEILELENLRALVHAIFRKCRKRQEQRYNVWFVSVRGSGCAASLAPQLVRLLCRSISKSNPECAHILKDTKLVDQLIAKHSPLEPAGPASTPREVLVSPGEPSLMEMTERIRRINREMFEDVTLEISSVFRENSAVRPKPGPPLSVAFFSQVTPKIDRRIETCVSREVLKRCRVICQVQRKFLLAEAGGHFFAVDQHAAAERVNLHAIQNNLTRLAVSRKSEYFQKITKNETACLEASRSQLEAAGWVFRISGSDLEISSAPGIGGVSCKGGEIFEFAESSGGLPAPLRRAMATAACHRSVRFGDHLEISTAQKIVDDLAVTDFPFQCAHGRPTIFPLPGLDIEDTWKFVLRI